MLGKTSLPPTNTCPYLLIGWGILAMASYTKVCVGISHTLIALPRREVRFRV